MLSASRGYCWCRPLSTRSGVHRAYAAIAAKAEKETAYHLRHSGEWLIRLGDGTEESHRRAQAAIDSLWPYTGELFQASAGNGVFADPTTLRATWDESVDNILSR